MQNFARMSVLVVESDSAQNRSISELLAELGVPDIVRVYTWASALEWLRSRGFDVMICAEHVCAEHMAAEHMAAEHMAAEHMAASGGARLVADARDVSPATRTLIVRTPGVAAAPLPEGAEAVEPPLVSAQLRDFLQRARDPRGGLWCEVPELSLTDILQMYHLSRRSISVLVSGPIAGRVHLVAGEIADAESGGLSGLSALSRLLEANTGLLRTVTPTSEVARTIALPFEHAIFEATRQLDERRRDHEERQSASPDPRPAPEWPGGVAAPTSASAPGPAQQASSPEPTQPLPSEPMAPLSEPLPGMVPFALVPPRQQSKRGIFVAIGVLAALVLSSSAGIYLVNRSKGSGSVQVVNSLSPQGAAPASGPGPAAAGGDARGATLGATAQLDSALASALASALDAGAARRGAGEPSEAEPDAAAPAPSFELTIASTPTRALVREGSTYLGRTPLELTIERASVADAPREFVLLMKGYRPYTLSQADSSEDVRAVAVLRPRRRSSPRARQRNRAPGRSDEATASPARPAYSAPFRH